jgi:hypothetical protein
LIPEKAISTGFSGFFRMESRRFTGPATPTLINPVNPVH